MVESSTAEEGAGGFFITAISVFMILMCAASIVFSIPNILKRNHKLAGGIMLATGIIGMFPGLVIFWLIPGTLLIHRWITGIEEPTQS